MKKMILVVLIAAFAMALSACDGMGEELSANEPMYDETQDVSDYNEEVVCEVCGESDVSLYPTTNYFPSHARSINYMEETVVLLPTGCWGETITRPYIAGSIARTVLRDRDVFHTNGRIISTATDKGDIWIVRVEQYLHPSRIEEGETLDGFYDSFYVTIRKADGRVIDVYNPFYSDREGYKLDEIICANCGNNFSPYPTTNCPNMSGSWGETVTKPETARSIAAAVLRDKDILRNTGIDMFTVTDKGDVWVVFGESYVPQHLIEIGIGPNEQYVIIRKADGGVIGIYLPGMLGWDLSQLFETE